MSAKIAKKKKFYTCIRIVRYEFTFFKIGRLWYKWQYEKKIKKPFKSLKKKAKFVLKFHVFMILWPTELTFFVKFI